jgi:hypothetical protein
MICSQWCTFVCARWPDSVQRVCNRSILETAVKGQFVEFFGPCWSAGVDGGGVFSRIHGCFDNQTNCFQHARIYRCDVAANCSSRPFRTVYPNPIATEPDVGRLFKFAGQVSEKPCTMGFLLNPIPLFFCKNWRVLVMEQLIIIWDDLTSYDSSIARWFSWEIAHDAALSLMDLDFTYLKACNGPVDQGDTTCYRIFRSSPLRCYRWYLMV